MMDLSDIPDDGRQQDLLGDIPDAPPGQPVFPAIENQFVDPAVFGESLAFSTMLDIDPVHAFENHEALKTAFQGQMASKPMSGAGGSFEPEERNWLTEIDAAIRLGGMDTVIQYMRSARVLGIDTTQKIKALEASSEVFGQTKRGGWSDAVFNGVRSTINSSLASIPGIGVGAVLGSNVPVVGTTAGAVAGFALGPGVVFSLAEYDRFMEEAEALGMSREDVQADAIISAVAEGGVEALTNLAGAKIFGLIGKGALSEPVKQGLLAAFGRFLGRIGMSGAVEIPGEMLTAAIQNQQRIDIGIETGRTNWEAAKEVVGSTAVQTLLTGGLMQAAAPSVENRVEPTVTVKPVDQTLEQEITGAVDEKIYEENRVDEGAIVEEQPPFSEAPKMSDQEMKETYGNEYLRYQHEVLNKIQDELYTKQGGVLKIAKKPISFGEPKTKAEPLVSQDKTDFREDDLKVKYPELYTRYQDQLKESKNFKNWLIANAPKMAKENEQKTEAQLIELYRKEYKQYLSEIPIKDFREYLITKTSGVLGAKPEALLKIFGIKIEAEGIAKSEDKYSTEIKTTEETISFLRDEYGQYLFGMQLPTFEEYLAEKEGGVLKFKKGVMPDKKPQQPKAEAAVEAPQREEPGISFPEYLAKNNLAVGDISGKSVEQLSELYPREYRSFTSPTLTEKLYQENREYKKPSIPKTLEKAASDTKSSIKKAADEIIGILSTRLENVNPALRTHLRNYEASWRWALQKDAEEIMPLLRAEKRMSKADFVDFDLARKNSDTTKILSLVNKYGMKEEYKRYRTALDNIYKRAKDVGVDLGYIEDYHPRIIKDTKGYLKEVRNLEEWPIISQAIADKQVELGPNVLMSDEEKARVVESMIRGYKLGAKPGQFKARRIQVVTAKLNKFYDHSDRALATYIRRANEHIEARKYLGRGKDTSDFSNLDDSISAYVIKQMAEGRIEQSQEQEVVDILRARFNPKGATGAWALYRDFAYLDTMGSFVSAVTQIEDLGYALYEAGVRRTAKGIWASMRRKPLFTRHDLGITTIAEELESTTNLGVWVRMVFKITGLEAIDTLGKETLVQGAIEKYQARARDDSQVDALRKELLPYYEKETDQLIADMKAGENTDAVKMLAFSVLSDYQPITLSEMPAAYVTGGNRRIFYMLKSFVLKRLDVHRRLLIREIASGDKARAKQGMVNFLKLSAALIACGAGADEIKDFMLGRKTSLRDKVVDNIMRVVGFSKYIIWTGRLEGRATALAKSILPPFRFIDSLIKDIENMEVSETVKSIPLGGKLYYWWFGKGAEREEQKQEKERKKKLTRRKPE